MIMESLKVFGEMDEGMITKIKYAKFRATHIHSKMMKGLDENNVLLLFLIFSRRTEIVIRPR